jgi:hypothetical protein
MAQRRMKYRGNTNGSCGDKNHWCIVMMRGESTESKVEVKAESKAEGKAEEEEKSKFGKLKYSHNAKIPITTTNAKNSHKSQASFTRANAPRTSFSGVVARFLLPRL